MDRPPGADEWAADPDALAGCQRQWKAAEGRLYGLVLTSPELYETSLGLVRALADGLAGVRTEAGLVAAYAGGERVLRDVAAGRGVDLGLVDTAAVLGAAFCLRHGELRSARARELALLRVRQAASAGRSWVTLHESGTLPKPGSLSAGYQVVEACLEVPWGVHGSVTFDLDSNAMVYQVEPVAVDVTEASWWVPDAPPVPERTCADVDSWRTAMADVRHALQAVGRG